MKEFKKFQQVTGGAQRGPSGGAGGSNNPYAAKPAGGGGGGGNNNRHKTRNRNKGGGGGGGGGGNSGGGGGGSGGIAPVPPPVAPAPQTSATPIQDANQPGVIANLATNKPLDYFSGLLSGQGQLTGSGPSVYENWQQNQFFNDQYSQFMNAKTNSPYDTSFNTFLDDRYGPGSAGLADAAQRQFNLATPTQRGDFNNPFNNSTGRTQFWG